MLPRGLFITDQGRALIAKLLALHTLALSRVSVGRGNVPEGADPAALTGLVEPVAEATSNSPTYEADTMMLTVEYRNDLNGGLAEGFWLSEYGVFAMDPDAGEVLFAYGALGDYPEWVSAAGSGGVDVRRYPLSVTVGSGAEVSVLYNPGSFVTAQDVEDYVASAVVPSFEGAVYGSIEMSGDSAPLAGARLHLFVTGDAPGYAPAGG
jgi:hypothetical protein